MIPHVIYIVFAFAFGACVGSFLNVVVYRLPQAQSWWDGLKRLMHPPSHCPRCDTALAWKDNIPVFGWLLLRGQCRYCHNPISARYPLVEALTGLLFAFYYLAFFVWGWGPCVVPPRVQVEWGVIAQPATMDFYEHWPIYVLYMFTIAALLAASLIDAELFIIPLGIPHTMAIVGVITHAMVADAALPGNLVADPLTAAVGAGGGIGLGITLLLWWVGWIPTSFPRGEPILEVDRDALEKELEALKQAGKPAPELPPSYTRGQIRGEMSKEMLFMMPALVLAGAMVWLTSAAGPWESAWRNLLLRQEWLAGMLGALNGALVGAFVVWLTRILGTLAFGKVAMGLGDVHLMFGVGAIVGGMGATVAFFVAPFFGIALAVWMLLTGKKRELPFGPYLSLGTGFVMLFYCPIAEYLRGGMEGLMFLLGRGAGQ